MSYYYNYIIETFTSIGSKVTTTNGLNASLDICKLTPDEMNMVVGVAALGIFGYAVIVRGVVPAIKNADTTIPYIKKEVSTMVYEEIPMLCGFAKRVVVNLHNAKYFVPQICEYVSSFFG